MSTHHDNAHPTDCTEALKQLFACLDGCLDQDRRRAIEAHVARCPCCLHAFQFEARMLAAIKEPCPDDASVEPLRRKVLAALMELGFKPEDRSGPASDPPPR